MTVTIVQEYVPRYRAAFFNVLRRDLAQHNVRLLIASGSAGPDATLRADADSLDPDIRLRQREIRILQRRLTMRLLPLRVLQSDLIILEQARRNLDAYLLFAIPPLARKTAVWGHGEDTVHQPGRLEKKLISALTRRAAWMFAYTDVGREAAIRVGVDPARTTVVQNSIDTTSLLHAAARVSREQSLEWQRVHGLPSGPCVAFVGGLDKSKRIDLLVEAWRIAYGRRPQAHLVIAGSGPQADLLRSESTLHLNIRPVGYADEKAKAIISQLASALVVPGRVGLVALDSATLGLPLITTTAAQHAPEFAYLTPGKSCVVTDGDAESLAAAIVRALDGEYAPIGVAAHELSRHWSVEKMASNFATGVIECLALSQRPIATRR